jgi:small subunit ribosomal protein S8
MSIDVIGNMLTSIRNACCLKKRFVLVPHSKFKESILGVFKSAGYIKGFEIADAEDSFGKKIKIYLKYVDGESAIHSLQRVSKPGIRIYKKPDCLKPIIGGLGLSVLSTSQGVISDIQARKLGVGGEVLLQVW